MFDTENKYLAGELEGLEIFLFLGSHSGQARPGQCAPVNSEKLVRLRKLVLMETGAQGAHF